MGPGLPPPGEAPLDRRLPRQAAEARLKLLQAQIQPHFIFNTLAALQHWVDTGDARAPAMQSVLNHANCKVRSQLNDDVYSFELDFE